MPITPRYTLTQTPTHVYIHVSIPHVRVSPKTLELIVDGSELHLFAPPTYLLKLVLPGNVVDEQLYESALECNIHEVGSESKCLVQEITSDLVQEIAPDNRPHELTREIERDALITTQWTNEDLPKMQYDPLQNHGTIIITLRKVHDELWHDLDLLGRLQQPLQNKNSLIVCTEENTNDADGDTGNDNIHDNGIMGELKSINQGSLRYGLFRNYHNVFTDYAREGLADEMLECPNPDDLNEFGDETVDRRDMRLEMENRKFDSDRYLSDASLEEGEDMIFDSAMTMEPHWINSTTVSSDDPEVQLGSSSFFTVEESHLLATLKHHTIPNLTSDQTQSILLTLADILFAYAYDHRTTDGESTIESSWTIMILSPTFSWLESYTAPYNSIDDVMKWCIRRSLIYPYLRNYELAVKIACDVATIFTRGRRVVLRCLLQVHSMMEKSECHYLFNKLYVDPMIWWIQSCNEDNVSEFGTMISGVLSPAQKISNGWANDNSNLLSKQFMGLGLIELEGSLLTEEDDDDDESSSPESDDADERKVVQLMQCLDIDATRSKCCNK